MGSFTNLAKNELSLQPGLSPSICVRNLDTSPQDSFLLLMWFGHGLYIEHLQSASGCVCVNSNVVTVTGPAQSTNVVSTGVWSRCEAAISISAMGLGGAGGADTGQPTLLHGTTLETTLGTG